MCIDDGYLRMALWVFINFLVKIFLGIEKDYNFNMFFYLDSV
jgi:hypothetical protein